MAKKPLVIATRGSELALWQAEHVKARLQKQNPDLSVELLVLKTTGDKILDRPLAEVGGKGLFVKEIEEALLDLRADVAVHSMKDVPAELASGLAMAAISEREDPRDALVSAGVSLAELRHGANVGTSSLRRACQLLELRPDLKIIAVRGNVPTRVSKVESKQCDAVILAAAGLHRLGLASKITEYLTMLPAAAQGALGIETRIDDGPVQALVRAAMHHEESAICVTAERGFLAAVQGGCQAPLAAHAQIQGENLALSALIGAPDGSVLVRGSRTGNKNSAHAVGLALGQELLARGGAEIMARLDHRS